MNFNLQAEPLSSDQAEAEKKVLEKLETTDKYDWNVKTQNKIQEQDHTPCNFFLELDTKKIRVEKRENGRRKAGG